SYEGWSTAGPGCGQVGYVLMAYPANLAVLEGDHFTITARPNPFLTVTLIRFLKPRPVPWWIKARYGLQGNWAIGIGVHRLFGGKLRLPLVRLP
ncbi:MAG TPA: hypothetical protein VN914_07655, partial [Polyangia bacterium]|nr:hypothetical protein [Polyangia bacterium]